MLFAWHGVHVRSMRQYSHPNISNVLTHGAALQCAYHLIVKRALGVLRASLIVPLEMCAHELCVVFGSMNVVHYTSALINSYSRSSISCQSARDSHRVVLLCTNDFITNACIFRIMYVRCTAIYKYIGGKLWTGSTPQ